MATAPVGYRKNYAIRRANPGKEDTTLEVTFPQQVVELSRDYVAPPADAIGRSSERDLLAKELRREMSASILRRIDTVSKRARVVEAAPQ